MKWKSWLSEIYKFEVWGSYTLDEKLQEHQSSVTWTNNFCTGMMLDDTWQYSTVLCRRVPVHDGVGECRMERKVFKGTLPGTSEYWLQRMPCSTHRYSAGSRGTKECRKVLKGAGWYPMVLFLREAVQKTVKERWKVPDGTLQNDADAKWCRRKLKVARWY